MEVDRRKKLNTNLNIHGKLPPQARDMEEAVLGSVMSNKNVLYDVIEKLKPEMFYVESNQKIFSAIIKLFAKNNPIDMLTVSQELRSIGELEMVGGSYYISTLTTHSIVDIKYHSEIIIEKYLQREAIRISTQTISEAYEDTGNAYEIIEKNQASVFSLLNDKHGNQVTDISALAAETISELNQPEIHGLVGVGTGYQCLDEFTNGWRKSDLIIVAARPSMGKTAFAMQLARNAAIEFDAPALVFSLEMSKRQLTERLLSSECTIFQDDILKRRLTINQKEKLQHASNKLLLSNKLFIDDTAGIGLLELKAKARRVKQQFGIGLIVIDYLQLMTGLKDRNGNREQEIASISRGLKGIAKDLDIPVIALSQLNRAVESQAGTSKRPNLSHLRESGAIEQDADQVLFLYRPEYYGIQVDENNDSVQGLTEIIFAKNRNGVCDTVKLEFNGAYMKFRDWNDKLNQANFKDTPGNTRDPSSGISANSQYDKEPF